VTNASAVARLEPQTPAPPISDVAAIIQVIERAALNPEVDIDKMERLLQMQERIMARNAKAAYAAALSRMQPELPVIVERGGIRDRAGNVQSTYARWEDINDAIKPVLARHGFALSFRTGAADNKVRVVGVLSHQEGHSEETELELPVDTSGGKNAVQAVGSSTSYGKRYTAAALLNLTSKGEDDDGRAGGGNPPVSPEQVEDLQERIERYGADIAKFCGFLKVRALAELPASRFDAAVKALEDWRAKHGAR
jgi:hypothetical protein